MTADTPHACPYGWQPDDLNPGPECPYCAGMMCAQFDGLSGCRHDVAERHGTADTPKEPRTAAGRALLRELRPVQWGDEMRRAILAIEAEAHAPESADLAAAVAALPGRPMGSISGTPPDPGYVSRAAVLALLRSRAAAPSAERATSVQLVHGHRLPEANHEPVIWRYKDGCTVTVHDDASHTFTPFYEPRLEGTQPFALAAESAADSPDPAPEEGTA